MTVTESWYAGDKTTGIAMYKGSSLDRGTKIKSATKNDTVLRKASNISEVVIVKVANKGLGIGIASCGTLGSYDYGIYLKYIAKGSPAPVKGELRLKDVLLSINKEKLRSKSVDEIYRILRNLPPGPVQFLIKRSAHSSGTDDSDGCANSSRPQSKGKPGKENQKSGVSRSYGSETEQDKTHISVSRPLTRSHSADGRQKLANKQNWFNYVEEGGGKKCVPASKGSLGIEYGQKENNDSGYSSLAKRYADKKARDVGDGVKKKVLFDEDNISLNSSLNKPSKRSSVEKMRHNYPTQHKLAAILSSTKSDAVAINVPTKKVHIDPGSSQVSEVPTGMEPHVIDIMKEEKTSLGISLVPAAGTCLGLFQIRFIFPGTAAALNGSVLIGDFIFSVNGIKLYNVSHPQAIHILKKCTVKCKLIVFRAVKKEKKTAEEETKTKEENELKVDVLPGSILEKRSEPSLSLLQKKLVLPNLPRDWKKGSNKKEEAKTIIKVQAKPSKKEDTALTADESDEDASEHDMAAAIPECICTNKRTKLGPFLIEHLKEARGLGIDVMMDEEGQCNITKVSPTGSIVNDKRITVGDVIVAVNDQLLSSKPISDVKTIIRSVPKGIVRLVIKAGEVEEECPPLPQRNKKYSRPEKIHRNIDAISINSSDASSDEDKSDRLSSSSFVAIPPDNSGDVPLLPPPRFKQNPPPPLPVSIAPELYTTNFPDDMSDVASLPPAPPRPSFVPKKSLDSLAPPPPRPFVPQNVIEALQHQNLTAIKEFDNISDVSSLPPAPPVPVTPRILMSLSADNDVVDDNDDNDSDVGSLYSCIPAPPPPLANGKKITPGKNPGNEFEGEGEEISRHPGISIDISTSRHKIIPNGTTGYNTDNRIPNTDNIPTDGVDGCINVSTPPAFDIKEHLGMLSNDDEVSAGSHESLTVYPEGIIVYNDNNKKKSLFSKLRNKMVLPSKGNAKEYTNVENAKGSKQKQRPVSAFEMYTTPNQSPKVGKEKKKKKERRPSSVDLSDKSTRDMIKASISQPDLTSMSSHEVDIMFKRRGSTDESALVRSIAEEWSFSQTKNEEEDIDVPDYQDNDSTPSSTSQLPRILSFRKKSAEKKNRKRNTSTANISPPRTPPPPPPPAVFLPMDKNEDDDDDEDFVGSSSGPSQLEIGYPEKLLAGRTFSPDDQCGVARSMSESSSSIPASYAAFGPTITSANASMDNLENTYNVIGGKEELNVTYNVMGGKEQDLIGGNHHENHEINGREKMSSTYVYGNDGVDSSNVIDDPYETIDEITSKLKSATKLKYTPPLYGTGDQATASAYDQGTHPPYNQGTHPQVDFSCSDPALSSTLTRDGKTYAGRDIELLSHIKQGSELSEKDKLDPKLQPFIMSQGVSALLSTWPSEPNKYKPSPSPYSDYDDDGWGSEFSSNVLDYSSTPEARRYPVNNSFDNSVSRSLEEQQQQQPRNIDNMFIGKIVPREPPPVKTKSFKNFFSRGSKGESNNAGDDKKATPATPALPDKMIIEHMSFGGGGTTGANYQDDADTSKESITKKNPVAKPPRRRSNERRSSDVEIVSPNPNDTYYENIQNYSRPLNHSESFEFPPPPLPGHTQNTEEPISPEKHNELYASIDYSSKLNRRSNFESLKDPDDTAAYNYNRYSGSLNNTSGENGYTSDDATVYSEPERNNSPGCSRRIDLTKLNGHDGYASINPIYRGTRNGEVSSSEQNEIQDGVFTIQFTREPGKCIGLSLIGGSETPLRKTLIKNIDEDSTITKCHIPLREGDEIIEINGNSVTGYTHSEVLQTIRDCPSTIQFKLHRSADRNVHLLQQQQASDNVMKRKLESERVIASLTSDTEILSLAQRVPRNETNGTPPMLSSFEADGEEEDVADQLNKIFANRPPAPSQFGHVGSSLPPSGIKVFVGESESRSSTPVQNSIDPNVVTFLDIDLHKEVGRGLGISVVGGPKHIINNGIRVKRLAPNSIAYNDGRLQKDDRIIAINGTHIKGMTQGDALNILKNIKDVVVLTVCRTVSQNDGDNNISHHQDSYEGDNDNYGNSETKDLRKTNSEVCLPTLIRQASSSDINESTKERRSRSTAKKNSAERSQSETRELKRKPSTRSRSRSPGIFGRLFRTSSRGSLAGDLSKEKTSTSTRKCSKSVEDAVKHTYPHTLYFDKTSASLDFKLTRSGKSHGTEPTIIVQSVRKESVLSKSLFGGDVVLSINGISILEFSDKDLKKFLRTLPIGAIPMVVQRS